MATVIATHAHSRGGRTVRVWLRQVIERVVRWRADISARRQLASLSDSTLADLGLLRGDLDRELARPFWTAPNFAALEQQRRHNGPPQRIEPWLHRR
jgi:uncharacterized protein YjiS (DUF1127 family)